jgi:hypothetical protein
MAIQIKHNFQSAKADSPDTSLIRPSNWNEDHIIQMATARLLGRTTAGTGNAEEISAGTGITLSGGTIAADIANIVTAAALNTLNAWTDANLLAAASKALLVDADVIGLLDSAASNAKKKATFANLLASVFTAARKHANANFLAGSMGVWDTTDPTKGLGFDVSGVTAGQKRILKMTDADLDLATLVPKLSPQQNFTFSTLITWAHGLGAVPRQVNARLVNITTNAGYAVGDRLNIGTYWTTSGATSGVGIGCDATLAFANVPGGYSVFAKGTFGNTGLTAASWKLEFEVFK